MPEPSGDGRALLDGQRSERDWQRLVVETAGRLEWRVNHVRTVRRATPNGAST